MIDSEKSTVEPVQFSGYKLCRDGLYRYFYFDSKGFVQTDANAEAITVEEVIKRDSLAEGELPAGCE